MAGELYTRPPNVIVGTAIQLCARGDWGSGQHDWANHMSWLSVYNKLDYVHLHAASLHVYSLWVRTTLLCVLDGMSRLQRRISLAEPSDHSFGKNNIISLTLAACVRSWATFDNIITVN